MGFSLRFLATCSNRIAISFVARGPDAMADAAQEKKKRRRYFYRKRPKDTTPLPKLNMDAVPDYGEVAARIMARMGFAEGMGLGRAGDGIREPVAVDAGQKKTGVGYVKTKKKRKRRSRKSKHQTTAPDGV